MKKSDKAQLISTLGFLLTSVIVLFLMLYQLYMQIDNQHVLGKFDVPELVVIPVFVLGISVSSYGAWMLHKKDQTRLTWFLIVSGVGICIVGSIYVYFTT